VRFAIGLGGVELTAEEEIVGLVVFTGVTIP
jgi:hypothetical protein